MVDFSKYDLSKLENKLADRIISFLTGTSYLHILKEKLSIPTIKEDKKFVPLKAEDISNKPITEESFPKEEIAVPSQEDAVNKLLELDSLKGSSSVIPPDNNSFIERVTRESEAVYAKYRSFSGSITIKVIYGGTNGDNKFGQYKTWYIIRNARFYKTTDTEDNASHVYSFVEAIKHIHGAISQRNSGSEFRNINSTEFMKWHKFQLTFRGNNKSFDQVTITGEMVNYYLSKFEFTKNRSEKFISCVYKGERYRIVGEDKTRYNLSNGLWVDKNLVTYYKEV